MKEIRSLEKMPLRYQLYDTEPWHSQGLRFFPVNLYLVFYLAEEADHTVTVIRIMYGGRDISKQLNLVYPFSLATLVSSFFWKAICQGIICPCTKNCTQGDC